MGQLNMLYNFGLEQDFMYKADTFIQQLNRMSELDEELVHLIHHEMKYGSGQIIDKTNEAIKQYQENNLSINYTFRDDMRYVASLYTDMINEMRGQNITLYYDVIIREKKR
ncbi:hypothetical protein [Saccharococcus caldoxylosilyticus]|uniref:hypothetical protein n=1 Tax=Saccharococcus caldoxylosilyticus TaxID=81408 RepID=UPI000363726C|nr:hypothetical protein [Parageobacillus caldoxylosilyticus]